ncbi:hypothetical protein ACJX0J_040515, partial [Zea mays]
KLWKQDTFSIINHKMMEEETKPAIVSGLGALVQSAIELQRSGSRKDNWTKTFGWLIIYGSWAAVLKPSDIKWACLNYAKLLWEPLNHVGVILIIDTYRNDLL